MVMPNKRKIRYYYRLENSNIVAQRKIGYWALARCIGSGVNVEVWQYRNKEGMEYVIMFLKNTSLEPYTRFYDELHFMVKAVHQCSKNNRCTVLIF